MNGTQKWIVAVAIAVMTAMILYPPWRERDSDSDFWGMGFWGMGESYSLGYAPLGHPPVTKARLYYSSAVAWPVLLIQLASIAGATAIMVVLFRETRRTPNQRGRPGDSVVTTDQQGRGKGDIHGFESTRKR